MPFTGMCMYMCTFLSIHTPQNEYVYVYIYMCVCTYIHVYACMCLYALFDMCMFVSIYIYM